MRLRKTMGGFVTAAALLVTPATAHALVSVNAINAVGTQSNQASNAVAANAINGGGTQLNCAASDSVAANAINVAPTGEGSQYNGC